MSKLKFATVWLDGCSGCHMSFLDMDERLIDLASKIEYVNGPYADFKFSDYPDDVDLCLIEGAVSNQEDLHKACMIRSKTKTVISFGDCAVNSNVPAMRNMFGRKECLAHSYIELATENHHFPKDEDLPELLETVHALHEIIEVDLFLPGCPPPADAIYNVLIDLLEGRKPNPSEYTRFGK